MTRASDDRGAEMRELFFETTQELLQSLNDDALRLEKAPQDKEVVRSIRRTVHTLKGDAAACGFHELSDLARRIGKKALLSGRPRVLGHRGRCASGGQDREGGRRSLEECPPFHAASVCRYLCDSAR